MDWTGQLAAGADPAAVAFGFAASAEREGIRIGGDYQTYLARTLDPGGQSYWVNQFLHGASNEDVVGGFWATCDDDSIARLSKRAAAPA